MKLCTEGVSSVCRRSKADGADSSQQELCIESMKSGWMLSETGEDEPKQVLPEIDGIKPTWTNERIGSMKPKCKKSSTNAVKAK